ncbi:Uncharacterised protein [Mycobacteroides abscessus subsp. abscessus]|nr:Uncharacterised protein [Mycobacteroides abscessus subsp. abscessus]
MFGNQSLPVIRMYSSYGMPSTWAPPSAYAVRSGAEGAALTVPSGAIPGMGGPGICGSSATAEGMPKHPVTQATTSTAVPARRFLIRAPDSTSISVSHT